MDKIYLVGGLDGKAFPSLELANAYAITGRKLSVTEIDYIDKETPVKKINGCILHFDDKGNYEIKPYSFNDLDDKPHVDLLSGYGKFRFRLILPIEKKDLTKDIINNILTVSLQVIKDHSFIYMHSPKRTTYYDIIENILKGCDDSYIAKIMLSFS